MSGSLPVLRLLGADGWLRAPAATSLNWTRPDLGLLVLASVEPGSAENVAGGMAGLRVQRGVVGERSQAGPSGAVVAPRLASRPSTGPSRPPARAPDGPPRELPVGRWSEPAPSSAPQPALHELPLLPLQIAERFCLGGEKKKKKKRYQAWKRCLECFGRARVLVTSPAQI